MRLQIGIFTCEFPPYPGGIATYTYELASAARRLGHSPTVFVPKLATDSTPAIADFTIEQRLPRVYRHVELPRIAAISAWVLARRRFDIVLAADLPNILALSLVPTAMKKSAAVHGTDVKSKLIGYINSYTPFRPFNNFDRIFSNSQFTKDLLLKHNRYVVPERIAVAPLGVSEFWHGTLSAEDVEMTVKPFAIEPDQFVLLSVGRIEPRKGLHQALEALSRLSRDACQLVTYLIVGRVIDREYADALRQQVHAIGMDIRFLGEVSQMQLRALYHRANLFLHTATADRYRAEGFGLVLLEAAACGLPVLATRVDAISEVVRDKETGFLADDGDIAAIAERIQELLQRPAALRLQSEASRAFAREFTWNRCARITFGDG